MLELRRECLEHMLAGQRMGGVAEAASKFLSQKYPHMLDYLPKTLGFGLGLDFHEATLLLNSKNDLSFSPNMVFNLAIGLHDVPLEPNDKLDAMGSVSKLAEYSMLVADTVIIRADGEPPELLTKHSVEWRDVSYFINENSEENIVKNQNEDVMTGNLVLPSKPAGSHSAVLSSRLRERAKATDDAARNSNREEKQAALMRHKLASRRIADSNSHKQYEVSSSNIDTSEVEAYSSTRGYPSDLLPSEVHVDMEGQVVFVPIHGSPVPFHISMIKNAVQPDPDRASAYLRLNFFTPGQSLGKDVAPATARAIEQHGKSSTFVKEMLYRSSESRRLTAAYRMIQELRKRYRQHAAKAAEEADLVAQEKLVKMRDQRIPRMADLTMRPFISGKKTVGTLEAHSNGLRFISKKHEIIDLMYANVKHSLFQPCENEVMVLIHFHLKNPVMVGKKKTHDVQFSTEVVDASVALDSARRSMYDPDELDEEQRERHLRKKLNEMFKEFCKKMERVAKQHHYDLEFDIPYRDLSFHGVPNREMVLIQPTVHCLVNLTETPFFIVELDHVEHVHFERCTLRATNFDMVIILKNFELAPLSVNAVPVQELDAIQEWLTDCSLTYTAGQASMSWKSVMNLVRSDDRFYEETDENGEPKPAGWQFLQADDGDGEEGDEEDDGDEDYDDDDEGEEDDEDEDEDDEDDDDEEEDEDDEEEDDDEDDDAMDWDSMEALAAEEDRQKRN